MPGAARMGAARNMRTNAARKAGDPDDDDGHGSKLATKPRGRTRGRTAVFFSNVNKNDADIEYLEDEYGEEDHESVNQRLEFRERHQMPAGYDFRGALSPHASRAARCACTLLRPRAPCAARTYAARAADVTRTAPQEPSCT